MLQDVILTGSTILASRFWGEKTVESYLRRLSIACNRLGDNPLIGRSRKDIGEGIRSLTFRDHVIVYKIIDEEHLSVLRVFHGREDLGELSL